MDSPTSSLLTSSGNISLVVGVTGHRDLIVGDVPTIQLEIDSKLANIKKLSGNATPILLSGLAEGSDQLVAEAALKLQWTVIAVLPMLCQDYLEDFDSAEKRGAFLNLKNRCTRVIEIPRANVCDHDILDLRNQQYRNQGIFVVRQAQLIIALWDGRPAPELGACGTAYAVKLCREGPPPVQGEVLAAPETTSLIHIPVRRQGNPDFSPVIEKSTAESDRMYVAVSREFLAFNKAAAKLRTTEPDRIKQSQDWLIPDESLSKVDAATRLLIDRYACVDALAIKRQNLRNRAVKLASIATLLGAFAQATNGIYAQTSWMVTYGLSVGLAYGLYLLLFKLPIVRIEDRYLEYRALAEALRVQTFWHAACIKAEASEHYLQLVKTEVGWIREALRSISLCAFVSKSEWRSSMEVVQKHWVEDQIAYFVGTAEKLGAAQKSKNLQKRLEVASSLAMAAGAVLVGVASAASLYPIPEEIRLVASAYSATLFLMGGVTSAYVTAMGYGDQAISYEKMGAIFGAAKRQFDNSSLSKDECLLSLGKLALAENSEWLMQHRKNAFKPQSSS